MAAQGKRRLGRLWSTVLGTWRQMRAADVQILAGSLAFASVISLVPLLAVSLSVFKARGGFNIVMKQIEPFILQYFVEASGAHISKFIEASIQRVESGALGFWGAIGLLVSSTKVFLDLETAVNRVWQERTPRFRIGRILIYWCILFLAPLALAGALGLLGSRGDLSLWSAIPKRTIVVIMTFIGFFCINKFMPSGRVSWRSALISSAAGTVGVWFAQMFYAQITSNILRYSKIYGSLASIPIFLLWLLVLWWICLSSVALCATLEGRQAHFRK